MGEEDKPTIEGGQSERMWRRSWWETFIGFMDLLHFKELLSRLAKKPRYQLLLFTKPNSWNQRDPRPTTSSNWLDCEKLFLGKLPTGFFFFIIKMENPIHATWLEWWCILPRGEFPSISRQIVDSEIVVKYFSLLCAQFISAHLELIYFLGCSMIYALWLAIQKVEAGMQEPPFSQILDDSSLSANWPPYFIPFSKAKQKKGSVLLYGNMFHFRKTLGIGVVYVKIYGTSCSLSKGKKCEKHNTFQKTQFSKKDFLLFVQLYNWLF